MSTRSSHSVRDRLASLEQEIIDLRAELARRESSAGAAAAPTASTNGANQPIRRATRRNLLKLGGAAAAAGLAVSAGELLRPGSVHAAAAFPARPADNPATFIGDASLGHPWAVEGVGMNGSIGVWGRSDGGIGVLGDSASNVTIYATGTGRFRQDPTIGHAGPPTASDGSFYAGEQIRDDNLDLWICVAGGGTDAGQWRKVAAPQYGYAGGALNLLPVPIRLLDTRAGAPVGFALPGHPIDYHATLQMQASNLTFQNQTIPAGASAVFGNLVVALAAGVDPGDGSSLICWPNGQSRPAAVNIVYNPGDLHGEYTSTFTLVAIGASDLVNLYSQPINANVAVDVIFDAFGFVM